MMSAPWSVRERAFSRKFSLKDSICFRDEQVQALRVPDRVTLAGAAVLQPILLGISGGRNTTAGSLLNPLSLDFPSSRLMVDIIHGSHLGLSFILIVHLMALDLDFTSTWFMFDVGFGSTLRGHFTQVDLLAENLNFALAALFGG